MVPSGDLLTSASDSKENPCGTLPSILPDHGRRCHTVSTGDKQGISVAVQIVANDLQPNFVTANQAGNGPDIVVGAHDWIGNLVQNSAIRPVVLSPEAEAN